MPALEEHRAGTERRQLRGRLLHGRQLRRSGATAGPRLRGCSASRPWPAAAGAGASTPDGVGLEQQVAVAGDEDRVDDEGSQAVIGHGRHDRLDDRRRTQHAGLGRGHPAGRRRRRRSGPAPAAGGRTRASCTPTVFWAVTPVRAQVPHTPRASKVLRSAWIPAPPRNRSRRWSGPPRAGRSPRTPPAGASPGAAGPARGSTARALGAGRRRLPTTTLRAAEGTEPGRAGVSVRRGGSPSRYGQTWPGDARQLAITRSIRYRRPQGERRQRCNPQ